MKEIRVILIVLLISSSVGIVNCSGFPRHVDPDYVVADNPTTDVLFDQYSQIYNLVISGNYYTAIDSIRAISNITATLEVSESIARYNELLFDIIQKLNQTERRIDSGNNYLRYLLDSESEFQFNAAFQNLLSANYSSQELGIESITLASLLKGDSEELLGENKKLDEYIEYINNIVEAGFNEIIGIRERKNEGLEESFLDLKVENYTPILGNIIVMEGVLRNNRSQGLPWKNLEIFIDNDYWDSVNTSDSGAFTISLEIPYVYKKEIAVRVEYYPTSTDVAFFTPAINQIIISPVYYAPKITVDMPEILFPGLRYTLVGRVDFQGLNSPMIELELFDKTSTTLIDKDGVFSFQFLISENQRLGQHKLRLSTESQGLLSPGLLEKKFSVEIYQSQVIVDRLFFPILYGPTEVSGRVISESARLLPDSIVKCKLGTDIIETYTDEDGVYVVRFENSPLFLSRRKSLTVFASPIEPWIGETQYVGHVTVVNLLTLALPSVLVLGYIISQRPKQDILTTVMEDMKTGSTIPKLRGLTGVYVSALDFVSDKTGLYLSPNLTLREYLEVTKPRLVKSIFGLFRKLTQMYESWFYGPTKNRAPIRTSKLMIERMEEQDE